MKAGETDRPELTPEMIERMRQTGIRLDREGRLWHEGTRITHPGLERALLRWLDRLPDGRPILRLDERRYAYLDVEDAHLLALSLTWRDDRAYLSLNDGSEEELAYDTLRVADDDAMYCKVRDGALWARLTTPAYYALAERVEPLDPAPAERGDTRARFALRARGERFPITPWSGPSSRPWSGPASGPSSGPSSEDGQTDPD